MNIILLILTIVIIIIILYYIILIKYNTNPSSTNPSSTNPSSTNPSFTNPSFTNPSFTNPSSTNPSFTNPSFTNPSFTNPSSTNPSFTNPSSTNPSSTNPSSTNPSQSIVNQITNMKTNQPNQVVITQEPIKSKTSTIEEALNKCKSMGIILSETVALETAKIALKNVINNTTKKIVGKTLETVLNESIIKIFSSSIKISKLSSSVLLKNTTKTVISDITTKTISSAGSKIASKLISEASKKVAENTAKKVAKTISEKILKSLAIELTKKISLKAASLGVKLTGKISAGPVGWATAIFDAGSMTLDFVDVGTNFTGFQIVANNNDIDEIQKSANNTYIDNFKKQNMNLPINGPLSDIEQNIENKEKQILLTQTMSAVYAEYTELTKNNIDKINIDSLNLSVDDTNEFISKLFKTSLEAADVIIDTPEFTEFIDKLYCIKYDGIYVNKQCSYKDYESCNKGNKNPTEAYYEFKNGVCGMTSYYAKDICNKNKLEYLPDKQHCKITKEYCSYKAQDYKSDNDGTCVDDKAATIFGIIFGDTITKGFKKIFDTDYTYTRSMKHIKLHTKCNDGRIENAGMCSEPCKPGYKSSGPFTCIYDGKGFQKNSYARQVGCANDREEIGGMCSLKCNPGFSSTSSLTCTKYKFPFSLEVQDRHPITIFDSLKECDNGYTKVGAHCFQQCPPDYVDTGVRCEPKTHTRKADIVQITPYCDDPDFEVYAGACYKKCKPGYNPVALNCTLTDCPAGYYMKDGICVSN